MQREKKAQTRCFTTSLERRSTFPREPSVCMSRVPSTIAARRSNATGESECLLSPRCLASVSTSHGQ